MKTEPYSKKKGEAFAKEVFAQLLKIVPKPVRTEPRNTLAAAPAALPPTESPPFQIPAATLSATHGLEDVV